MLFRSLFGSTTGSKGNAEKGGERPQKPVPLTHLQRKQLKAQNALKNPKKPHAPRGSQWTFEHQRILTENLRKLVESTSDLASVRKEDDEIDEDGYEGQERTFLAQSARRQFPAGGQQPRGKKRQREDNINGSRANVRPLKKLKLKAEITQHVLEEFETLKPQPLQFVFKAHPLEDRSDEWFVVQFRKLFRRIQTFAHDYFGRHDIDEGSFHQPWAAGMSPEFLRYVEDVAEADPMDGNWDKLLLNTIQREWLVVGIIMRVLEIQVFGPNLWGVDQQEKELLHSLDRAFFTGEGFGRQALRSNTVRTILGNGAITKNFHTDVVDLTAKVALLLKPLSFFLYSRRPKDGKKNPHIQDQYQALHNIVAIAAYLSICIRLSPTIFYFSNVETNTPYDHEGHHSVDADGYQKSAEAIEAAYEVAAAGFRKKREEIEREIAKLRAAGKSDTSRAVKKVLAKLKDHLEMQPNPPGVTHEVLTKIAVWPNISRYKPGASGDDEAGIPLAERRGIRIFEVSKSAVVCYAGIENRIKRTQARVKLAAFVEEKMKKYAKKQGRLGTGVVIATAAAAAAGIPYFFYGLPTSFC